MFCSARCLFASGTSHGEQPAIWTCRLEFLILSVDFANHCLSAPLPANRIGPKLWYASQLLAIISPTLTDLLFRKACFKLLVADASSCVCGQDYISDMATCFTCLVPFRTQEGTASNPEFKTDAQFAVGSTSTYACACT